VAQAGLNQQGPSQAEPCQGPWGCGRKWVQVGASGRSGGNVAQSAKGTGLRRMLTSTLPGAGRMAGLSQQVTGTSSGHLRG
jgi:hypothetical protein